MNLWRRRGLPVLAAALAVTATLAGCGGSDDAAATSGSASGSAGSSDAPVTITAGVAASQSSTALLLGLKQGFFEEQGIKLEIGKSATGAGGVPQLINGQQQVVLGGISAVVTAASSHLPVTIVSGAVADHAAPEGTQYQTMVAGDSSIRSFKDLAGKTVAVNSLKCCWEFWMREAVAKDGGDASSLKLVQLAFPDQVSALKQGSVDAISTAQPFATQLRQQGFRDIGDSPAVAFGNPDNSNTVFSMSTKFIKEHPGIVERWRTALKKSSDYANAHPDETRAQIVEQTGADAQLVASAPLPVYTAEVDKATIQKEAQFAVKYKVIPKAPDYATLVAK